MLPIILLIALCATAVSSGGKNAPEKVLAKHLMDKYDEIGIVGRPVTNVNDAVKVEVGLNLLKILKVEKGFVTFTALLELEWVDPFLAWEPKKFGGVKSIALPADEIWTPDVTIYNDYHQGTDDQEDDMEETDLLVFEDGKVLWIPRMTYKTSCQDDPKIAGQMTCTLLGGSWVHDATKIDIDLEQENVDMEMFDPTPGIELVSHSAKVEDKEFECCPGLKYSMFSFTLVIKTKGHCDAKHGHC